MTISRVDCIECECDRGEKRIRRIFQVDLKKMCGGLNFQSLAWNEHTNLGVQS